MDMITIVIAAGAAVVAVIIAGAFLTAGYVMGRNVYIPPEKKERQFDPGGQPLVDEPDPWDRAMPDGPDEETTTGGRIDVIRG